MKDLIVKSAMAKENNFECCSQSLGMRFEKLTVINEMGCMNFTQKEW